MQVTKYIKENGLESLADLNIKVKEYDHFYVLNYSQIDSPKTNPTVMECRGLIVNKVDYEPLAQSFTRFFNYGEADTVAEVSKRTFAEAVVWEKVDGSLITVWFNPYTEEWQCSTRSMGYAEGNVGGTNSTFKELFERAIDGRVEDVFEDCPTNHTFVFELVSPESRVTKQYKNTKAYLINAWKDGEEVDLDYLFRVKYDLGVRKNLPLGDVGHYPLNTVEDCISNAAALDSQDEGYVVQWPDGYRVKIKNPAHVALAHLRNNGALSDKRILALISCGEAPEYLVHFPEDQERFGKISDTLKALRLAVSNEWLDAVPKLINLTTDTEKAKHISTLKYKNFHFAKWRHNRNFDEYFSGLTENKKIQWLT